jgi:uncharacterized SAM-binding protein YcdF (DUF218 family)
VTVAVEQRVVVKPGVRRRVLLGGLSVLLLGSAMVAVLYLTVPKGNEGTGPVDALLVLGTPAGLHGEINPMQVWRVDEAVREYRRGVAPRILFAGGAAANKYVEADVMAGLAEQQGVPASAILRERRSHTTLENIFNSAEILRAHGWNSVEVVSSRQHLPRAAVLLEKTGLQWRVHAAPTPGWPRGQVASAWVEEAVGTAALRVFGRRSEPVLHALALLQHRIAWCVRWVVYRVEGRLAEVDR